MLAVFNSLSYQEDISGKPGKNYDTILNEVHAERYVMILVVKLEWKRHMSIITDTVHYIWYNQNASTITLFERRVCNLDEMPLFRPDGPSPCMPLAASVNIWQELWFLLSLFDYSNETLQHPFLQIKINYRDRMPSWPTNSTVSGNVHITRSRWLVTCDPETSPWHVPRSQERKARTAQWTIDFLGRIQQKITCVGPPAGADERGLRRPRRVPPPAVVPHFTTSHTTLATCPRPPRRLRFPLSFFFLPF